MAVGGQGFEVARDEVMATAAMPRAVFDILAPPEGCMALAAAATAAMAPPLGFLARAANSFWRSFS